MKAFKQLGGADGIAKKLGSDIHDGIKTASAAERAEIFGINKMPSLPPKSFWSMVWEQLQDPTLILLMGAASVSASGSSCCPCAFALIAYCLGVLSNFLCVPQRKRVGYNQSVDEKEYM